MRTTTSGRTAVEAEAAVVLSRPSAGGRYGPGRWRLAALAGITMLVAGCSGDTPDGEQALPQAVIEPQPSEMPSDATDAVAAIEGIELPPERSAVVRGAFRCGESVFEVEYRDESLRIEGGEGVFVLAATPAASGARFVGDDGREFWSRGDEAMLTFADGDEAECTLTDERSPWAEARERGLVLRGFGQEPSWLLEIHGADSVAPGRAVFLTLGGEMVEFDDTAVENGSVHTFGDGAYTARVETGLCRDSMSGERIEHAMVVETPTETYSGCGRVFEDVANIDP